MQVRRNGWAEKLTEIIRAEQESFGKEIEKAHALGKQECIDTIRAMPERTIINYVRENRPETIRGQGKCGTNQVTQVSNFISLVKSAIISELKGGEKRGK